MKIAHSPRILSELSGNFQVFIATALTCIVMPASFAATDPRTDDLWDISQGITVGNHSAAYNGQFSSDVSNMFGGQIGTTAERVVTIFADNQPAEFTHFVEWQTSSPVVLAGLRLYAAGDGPQFLNEREFAGFILEARMPNASDYSLVLNYTPTHPYQFVDSSSSLLVDASFPQVTASEFRAQFVQYTSGRGYDGPRIVELDAIGVSTVPEPSVWLMNGVVVAVAGMLGYRQYRRCR